MEIELSNFLRTLSKIKTVSIPLYCTGFPEFEFIKNYLKNYKILSYNDFKLILKGKNYSIIKNMGFDAISIWDFRRGEGGYSLEGNFRVDGWGRIYKENWYQWDGVIKNKQILENWEHLNLPSESELLELEKFLINIRGIMDPVLSLPGLFEKTWQGMGYVYFAKSLKKDIDFINYVIAYFKEYIIKLIKRLQIAGAKPFLLLMIVHIKKGLFYQVKSGISFFLSLMKK